MFRSRNIGKAGSQNEIPVGMSNRRSDRRMGFQPEGRC